MSDNVDEVIKNAVKGDSAAQCNLGLLYQKGKGVEQDYTKAYEWYEKAALQGDSDAQVNLGWLYDNGKGVEQDYTKASEWFIKANEAFEEIKKRTHGDE